LLNQAEAEVEATISAIEAIILIDFILNDS